MLLILDWSGLFVEGFSITQEEEFDINRIGFDFYLEPKELSL